MRLQGDQNVITDLVDKNHLLKMLRYLMTLGHNHTNGLDRSQTRFHKNWTFEKSEKVQSAHFPRNPKPHESDWEWVKNNWK